jgi:hypothetical protein
MVVEGSSGTSLAAGDGRCLMFFCCLLQGLVLRDPTDLRGCLHAD